QQPFGRVEQIDDVLQEAADVGVVVSHAGGHAAEAAEEVLVHQEALGERLEGRIADLVERLSELLEQGADVVRCVRQEVGQLDGRRFDLVEAGEYDLQRALEKLHFAAGPDEVPDVERAENRLAGIPQAGVDGAGAVAQIDLNIEIAVAVGP